MSQESEEITLLWAELATNDIVAALTALVAYEYLITLHQEVATIWQQKWSGVKILFLINRYLLILYMAFGYLALSPESCLVFQRLLNGATLAQYVVFAFFSAFRIYALWDSNVWLFFLILLPDLVPVGTNILAYSSSTIIYSAEGDYCAIQPNFSPSVSFRAILATRIALISADVLVLALTWIKLYGTQRRAFQNGVRTPLVTLIIRDGTIYFIAFLVMNILQMVIESLPSLSVVLPMSTFFVTLPPILISRFLLNLRQVDQPATDGATPAFSHSVLSVVFRVPESMLGNIGEPLEHGPFEPSFDEGGEMENEGPLADESNWVVRVDVTQA